MKDMGEPGGEVTPGRERASGLLGRLAERGPVVGLGRWSRVIFGGNIGGGASSRGGGGGGGRSSCFARGGRALPDRWEAMESFMENPASWSTWRRWEGCDSGGATKSDGRLCTEHNSRSTLSL